jgi:SulP family sulfate permease
VCWPHYVAHGIGYVLFGAFIVLTMGAFISSIPGVMIIPQDTPAAILALIAAGVAGAMPAAAPLEATFITVVAAIIITTLLAGLTFILVGRFKLSGFARFIPYPVVGGFLAGTGWLLAKGAFSVMTDMPLTLKDFPPCSSRLCLQTSLWWIGVPSSPSWTRSGPWWC